MSSDWPDSFEDEASLDDFLTRPGRALVEFIPRVPSPLLLLGCGGKLGPSLAVLARRAADQARHPLEVIAVSRFTQPETRTWLEQRGVRTLACDLFEADAVARLPDARHLVFLVGQKFGTTEDPSTTWAVNTLVPARVAERYPDAHLVALSTGNVYPFSPVMGAGSRESDPLTPHGEYPNAAVARERLFEFFSRRQGTPIALLRLFYAVEVRYGVLADIARRVAMDVPLSLANGHVNCIWQGDANDMILRALDLAQSPPTAWNLCRPETYSVAAIATRFGELLGRRPRFEGHPSASSLLGDSRPLCDRLGEPAVDLESMIRWVARWVAKGGRDLRRPTHFEVRDGQY